MRQRSLVEIARLGRALDRSRAGIGQRLGQIEIGLEIPLNRGRRRRLRPARLGAAQQRLELVERAAHLGRRLAHLGHGRSRLLRHDLEAGLLAHRRARRLAPLGEDVLERIVLPDDAGQFRKRVGLLPRAGRLPCSAQLALEIFEIERETVPSWLTHGTIHSSTSRLFLWKNRELCAVNLTLCAPPEKLFRQRISSGAATPATARPEARTLRTACTNANLAKVDFRSV